MPTHRGAGSGLGAPPEADGALALLADGEGALGARTALATGVPPQRPATGRRAAVPGPRHPSEPARVSTADLSAAMLAPVAAAVAAEERAASRRRSRSTVLADAGAGVRTGAGGAPRTDWSSDLLAELVAISSATEAAEVRAASAKVPAPRSGRRRAEGAGLLPGPSLQPLAEERSGQAPPTRSAARAAEDAAAPPAARVATGAPAARTPAPVPHAFPHPPSHAVGRPRSRRAAHGPADGETTAAPTPRPGSRRARRAGAPPAPTGLSGAEGAGAWAATEALAAEVARLQEALAPAAWEPTWAPAPAPAAPSGPVELDLRTDPSLGSAGWVHHLRARPVTAMVPEVPAPAAPTGVATAPAPVVAALPGVLEALEPSAVEHPAFVPSRGRGAHRLPRRARAALPQIGVVGLLGLATLAAPVVGQQVQAATGAGAAGSPAATMSTSQAADALVRRASEVISRGAASDRALPAAGAASSAASAQAVADAAAAKAAADAAAASQAQAEAAAGHQAALAALVPGCSGVRPDVTGERNGHLRDDQLCGLWQNGYRLRSDAAVALGELDLAYRAHFGTDIVLSDSYRSYAEQVSMRRRKPDLAARPGTSEHGWGLAVDLGDGVENSDAHYDWLIENAPRYGWDHPAWARRGGGGPYEPWHWEYFAGE